MTVRTVETDQLRSPAGRNGGDTPSTWPGLTQAAPPGTWRRHFLQQEVARKETEITPHFLRSSGHHQSREFVAFLFLEGLVEVSGIQWAF